MLALAACGDAAEPQAHLRIAGADAERGRTLAYRYGCGTCHTIPHVPGARGTVGPLLEGYAGRSVLAGIVPNTPTTLVAWLLDPGTIDPRTAMPAVGLDAAEARDIAAFLYTLEAGQREVYPDGPPLRLEQPSEPELPALRRAVNPSTQDGA